MVVNRRKRSCKGVSVPSCSPLSPEGDGSQRNMLAIQWPAEEHLAKPADGESYCVIRTLSRAPRHSILP